MLMPVPARIPRSLWNFWGPFTRLAAGLILCLLCSDFVAARPEDPPGQEDPATANEEPPPIVRRRLELEVISAANVSRLEEIHSEPVEVTNLVWRPDSRELVGIILNRNKPEEGVEVRDGETLEVLHQTGAGRKIAAFAFNPKLPQVGWVTTEGRVEVLQTESGEGYYIDDIGRNANLSFSPDGKILAIGGQSGSVRLYQAESGELIRVLEAIRERFTIQPIFSPDGRWLAVAPQRGPIRIWEIASGELKVEIEQKNTRSVAMGGLFDPKSERLLTIHHGGKIVVWNALTGEELLQKELEEQNPTGARWVAAGDLLATVGPGVIAFWKPEDLSLVHEIDAPGSVVAFSVSPDGRRLLTLGRDPPLQVMTVQVYGVPRLKMP